jgi:threonine dehydrogenase-like Zn-dependent dehydrogenase
VIRAAVLTAPGAPIETRELPEPALEPGAVLLETILSEVCGTDVHLRHGRLSGVPYPIVPGHVSVGRVVRIAGRASDVEGRPVREGDVVTFLDVHETCHACWYCLVAKQSTRCPHRRVYGITYSSDDGPLGGWAERIWLKPGVRIVPLPEGVTPERWMGGGCGLPTSLHAIDRAEIRLGDRVAVQGSGPVGLSAAALARLSGAGLVVVLGDPPARLEAARAFGADLTIAVGETSPEERVERVREATGGRGADVTIEATGVPSAVPEGMRMTRDGGRLVVVGQYTNAGNATFNPHEDLNRRHLEVRGSWGFDYSHLHRAMEIVARHGAEVRWERAITHTYGLDEMDAALDDVEAGRVVKAVVRPTAPPGASA